MRASRSFTEYVKNHFDNELFNALSDYLEEVDPSVLDLRLNRISNIGRIELYDTEIQFVNVADLPGSRISFDVVLDATLIIYDSDLYHNDETEAKHEWFTCKCEGDLACDLEDMEVTAVEPYSGRERKARPMSDSLVRIISKDQLETVATEFLRRHYPEALLEPIWVDPAELAGRMGLNVIRQHITKDMSVFGQIYFRDSTATVYDAENDVEKGIDAPRGTVLVDPDVFFQRNLGAYNNTIIHECVHWDQHQKAFMLERLFNEDVTQIRCEVTGGIQGGKNDATKWMEWQANELAPRIQMPMRSFKIMASKRIKEYRELTGKFDLIDVMEPVIDALAADFGVSRLSAKIRMIEAGYEEAIGTFNWTDGHYVATHRFKKGSLKENQTFTISAEDLAAQVVSNPKLREIVFDGLYTYVDSHLVIASEKYIHTGSDGLTVLTDYARNHMDECALAFDMSVIGGNDNRYFSVCYLNKDKDAKVILKIEYGEGLQYSTPERQKEVLDDKVLHDAELFKKFTSDYVQCLQVAFEDSGMTYAELASDIKMNSDVVSRIINGKHEPAVKSLALICMGLKLPYKLSSYIINNAPCNLVYSNEEHIWIDTALQTMTGQSMTAILKFLSDHGVSM